MTAEYPQLHQFLGGYFHQDWSLDDASAHAVIERFKRENEAGVIIAVKQELGRLLATSRTEDELAHTLAALGCEYYAPGDNTSYSAWLRRVHDQL